MTPCTGDPTIACGANSYMWGANSVYNLTIAKEIDAAWDGSQSTATTAAASSPLTCPDGQIVDSLPGGGDDGSCNCDMFCASDWKGVLKQERPQWTGSVSAFPNTSTSCICVQATHWCTPVKKGVICENACDGKGVPKPQNYCVPGPPPPAPHPPPPPPGVEGSGNTGFAIVVNGVKIFSRGGNLVPFELLEQRVRDEYVKRTVQSVHDGNMNIIRIWGGGIYQDDVFFDECNRLGIMVFHDMMFSLRFYPHDAGFEANVKAELAYQIAKVIHHPSIVRV